MTFVLGIGTVKGAWFATSDDRTSWRLEGPVFKGWEIGTMGRAPSGDWLLSTGSTWYGPALHRSPDRQNWSQVVEGPAYDDGSDRTLERIWALSEAGGVLYAGVAEAGLFRSTDGGETWHGMPGLNDHHSRSGWTPGLGGLAAHRILVDAGDPERIWVAISAVGVFRSEDGGSSFRSVNGGVTQTAPGDDPDIGYCVHGLAADPDDADRIWRQDHSGVYRTADGGDTWERIEEGLPARFGFPIVRDRSSGSLFIVPLESDEYRMPVDGRFAVYRSTDDGASWHDASAGLPEHPAYAGVLRGAMDTDGLDPGGLYLGTTSGRVWFTTDAERRWEPLPATFPRITSVRALS
jgi:photosystem II stability/assembly factor-like uncharacterized protein